MRDFCFNIDTKQIKLGHKNFEDNSKKKENLKQQHQQTAIISSMIAITRSSLARYVIGKLTPDKTNEQVKTISLCDENKGKYNSLNFKK